MRKTLAFVLLNTVSTFLCGATPDDPAPARESSGVTVMLPTLGVAVDASGTLRIRAFNDTDELQRKRAAALQRGVVADVMSAAPMRKVSLRRLDEAIQVTVGNGDPTTSVMRNLAGLTRVQYVFCYPDDADIVLAGPAEGWVHDPAGRAIGVETGRPIVQLEDLAVAVRQFAPGRHDRPFVGCTINPGAGALARLRAFQQTIPRTISESQREATAQRIVSGTEAALGMADIHVFGINPRTHMARVLVEADYRMKRIAVGLEPPPVRMTTFFSALRRAPTGIQRWWFTPNYDCLRLSQDGLAFELVGDGVQLQTENLVSGPNGALINPAARPSGAAKAFATAFTRKYSKISVANPVFASLRNMIDLLVVAAQIQAADYHGQAGWSPEAMLDESVVATETHAAPLQAPCSANAIWKGSRLIAPAGGGVSIQPHRALEKAATEQELTLHRESIEIPPDSWWW